MEQRGRNLHAIRTEDDSRVFWADPSEKSDLPDPRSRVPHICLITDHGEGSFVDELY